MIDHTVTAFEELSVEMLPRFGGIGVQVFIMAEARTDNGSGLEQRIAAMEHELRPVARGNWLALPAGVYRDSGFQDRTGVFKDAVMAFDELCAATQKSAASGTVAETLRYEMDREEAEERKRQRKNRHSGE